VRNIVLLVLTGLLLVPTRPLAQQSTARIEDIVIRTTTLPKIYIRQPARFELKAEGGVPPLRWQVTRGELPPGLTLSDDGVLSGVASKLGTYDFTLTVSDNSRPPHERSQNYSVRVTAPLLAEWSRPPKVNGQRIEGAIKVTNDTEEDFDLTEVVMAVNEIGRATAIGYQRFTLKAGTEEFEIPFGENLPFGAYDVNVDVVAEVAATNSIYRSRLVGEKLVVQQGP
jgi:hypothetical protein